MARDVVWDTPIRPKDAVHVATAAFNNIGWLHTFDNGMIATSGLIVQGQTIQCLKPIWHPQAEIDMKPRELPLMPSKSGNGADHLPSGLSR